MHSRRPLQDRVAIITGGGSGIGRAIALRLAADGARIALCGRRLDALRETRDLLNPDAEALILPADITDQQQVFDFVKAVAGQWGRLDILVNNAGLSKRTPIEGDDVSDATWHAVIATNLTALYLLARAAAPYLPSDGAGRIINIASVLGRFGVPGYTAYCAAKHGVIGFTRALALELAPRRITVNAICPGWVETDMAAESVALQSAANGMTAAAFRQQAEAAVPLKRFLDPEEIAGLAAYLASDEARGMTGQALNLCGGAVMS